MEHHHTRVIYPIITRSGEGTKLSIDKETINHLQTVEPGILDWVQNTYSRIELLQSDLTRRELGNAVRKEAFVRAQSTSSYKKSMQDLAASL